MTIITAYIIDDDGLLQYEHTGVVEVILDEIESRGLSYTLQQPPTYYSCKWNGLEWESVKPSDDLIKERQERAWGDIKAKRYEASIAGVYVPSVDKVFHTDATSVIQYNNIGNMIALGIYEPIEWKVMDNTWITMTEDVFKDLQKAMIQNTNRIYRIAEEHKAKMMELDNPEDYDYSEGWE